MIDGEDVQIEAFVPIEEVRKRYFNCQGFGHIMKLCKNQLVYGGCSLKGHAQKDCTNPWIHCIGYNRNHRTNNQRCPRYQLMTPSTNSSGTTAEEDTPIRGANQREPTKPLNTPVRPSTLKESTRDLGNKDVDLIVVPIAISIDTPNMRKESQEIKIDLSLTHPPISVEVL